ncbi:MAG TPA: DinB family protein, partial [Acidimicrobiales bacterium]|nr:DinB family protein [Acidimicrobiales bacterium]
PECPECGFDGSAISELNAEEAIWTLGPRYHAVLFGTGVDQNSDSRLRQRPAPHTWSALEYAAHMRDVISLWGFGLHQLLTVDDLRLPAVEADLPDRVAAESDYNSQGSTTVSEELAQNAQRMSRKVATISADQWRRRAWFGDVEVTPLWIVRKVAHEGHHHLMDIERSLGA